MIESVGGWVGRAEPPVSDAHLAGPCLTKCTSRGEDGLRTKRFGPAARNSMTTTGPQLVQLLRVQNAAGWEASSRQEVLLDELGMQAAIVSRKPIFMLP